MTIPLPHSMDLFEMKEFQNKAVNEHKKSFLFAAIAFVWRVVFKCIHTKKKQERNKHWTVRIRVIAIDHTENCSSQSKLFAKRQQNYANNSKIFSPRGIAARALIFGHNQKINTMFEPSGSSIYVHFSIIWVGCSFLSFLKFKHFVHFMWIHSNVGTLFPTWLLLLNHFLNLKKMH